MADVIDKPESPAITQEPALEELKYYRVYRDRITSEDTLISNRLTWLLTPQAVLYGFVATSIYSKDGFSLVGLALIALLGIVICWLGRRSIEAALTTVKQVREQYDQNYPHPDPRLPSLTAEGDADAQGSVAARRIPLCLIAGWLLLFLYRAVVTFLRHA